MPVASQLCCLSFFTIHHLFSVLQVTQHQSLFATSVSFQAYHSCHFHLVGKTEPLSPSNLRNGLWIVETGLDVERHDEGTGWWFKLGNVGWCLKAVGASEYWGVIRGCQQAWSGVTACRTLLGPHQQNAYCQGTHWHRGGILVCLLLFSTNFLAQWSRSNSSDRENRNALCHSITSNGLLVSCHFKEVTGKVNLTLNAPVAVIPFQMC